MVLEELARFGQTPADQLARAERHVRYLPKIMSARSRRLDRILGAHSIRSHLIAFALALVLPILGFSGYVLWRYTDSEQQHLVEEAHQLADQTAMAIDRELTGMLATVQALATSPSLEAGIYSAFHRQASNVLRIGGAYLRASDVLGRQLFNTGVGWGEALPPVEPGDGESIAAASHRPFIGDYAIDPVSGNPAVAISVPVFSGGSVILVLTLSVPTSHLHMILEQNVLKHRWYGVLVDRGGVFLARTRRQNEFAGQPAPRDLRALPNRGGMVVRANADGERVVFAYQKSEVADWLVGIGVPTEVARAPGRRSLLILLAAGTVLLALSILLALLFGRRIALPLRTLSVSAARLGRGEPVPVLSTGLREANHVGLSMAAAAIGLRERSAALRTSEERYRLATEAFQGAVFDFDVATRQIESTPRLHELVGEGPPAVRTMDGWLARVHPEDRPTFEEARRTVYEGGAPQYEAEYRVRHRDGSWIWVWHRALAMRDREGKVCRVIGAILDITARRHAEEHLRLLVNELNHRVKNTLATVQSVATQSLKNAVSVDEARSAFEARLMALSRAHNILTRENWEGADLRTVAYEVLEPYRSGREDRFHIEGAEVWVDPANAVAISMGLHELATNAVKYGALTSEGGRVSISWSVESRDGRRFARLVWSESGGPPVFSPARKGFGSRLIERGLAADLGGDAKLEFRPEGVVCTLVWALDPACAQTAVPTQAAPLAVAR
jgi:PAS domain S-box-containing protein